LALTEEISTRDGSVEHSNFYDYTVVRVNDVPEIRVELIPAEDHPTGVGQMPVTVAALAVNHAVVPLSGVWLRETPMTPERVKKALG
jgi:isoquinoline 1-oxidoreductase subunit beta